MARITSAAAALAAVLATAEPAGAVFSGAMSERAPPSDSDYAAALEAKEEERWEDMRAALTRLIARRPWHDNGHSLLGYAYRQLGEYERSLAHYRFALQRNPRHRGALEYMAVTLLHMDRLGEAKAARDRLWKICGNMAVTFSDGQFGTGCEEWEMLDVVIRHFEETGEIMPCH